MSVFFENTRQAMAKNNEPLKEAAEPSWKCLGAVYRCFRWHLHIYVAESENERIHKPMTDPKR